MGIIGGVERLFACVRHKQWRRQRAGCGGIWDSPCGLLRSRRRRPAGRRAPLVVSASLPWWYNTRMGRKDGENLNVVCPCCQAKLVIDPIFGAVLSHEAHVKMGPDVDLTQAHSILEEQKKKREEKFADSLFQETNKEDILAKKFEEAMKKAKDAPAGKPIRDFDLD